MICVVPSSNYAWEITKALREECRKSYGESMGIDDEEEMMKELRRMS